MGILNLFALQHDIERLEAKVQDLELMQDDLRRELAAALQERDEWKASAMRSQLNREFKSTLENLGAENKRFLPQTLGNCMPDFEHSLRQQLHLMETHQAQPAVGRIDDNISP